MFAVFAVCVCVCVCGVCVFVCACKEVFTLRLYVYARAV
jgi:hypothetical protein